MKVPAGKVINGDYFAAGNVVEISGTVNGDVYATGGQVLVDGRINGDLLAAAGSIIISGGVSQNARIAGGNITIDGEIGRNLTVAGGDIELRRSGAVRGGVVAAGGKILLAGPVGKDVKAAGRSLIVSDKINGNLDAAGDIHLVQGADITGNLRYWSGSPPLIGTGAKVEGKVTPYTSTRLRPGVHWIRRFFAEARFFIKAVSIIATFVIGLLLAWFFPNLSGSSVATLRKRPLASLGLGLIFLVIVPIISAILLMTIVGALLAFILLAVYVISLYLSRIFVISCVGDLILGLVGKTGHSIWAFVIGMIIYSVFIFIPVVGCIAAFLALLFGVGTAVLTVKGLST